MLSAAFIFNLKFNKIKMEAKYEIKLKAKEPINGYKKDETVIIVNSIFDRNIGIAFFPINKNFEIVYHRQFTGNKDKNGTDIFDGDFDDDGNCVVWCSICNGWEFAQLDVPTKDICISCHRCDGNFFFEDHISDFEIVGNVFS
jgi:hypothetical protein